MCGIVGYVGHRNAIPILLDGLRRLEYRGYDSAGLTVLRESGLKSIRRLGKVESLVGAVDGAFGPSGTGIAHTRWATHGEPSESNAHPQFDCSGSIAIVHNGIIENHSLLRRQLEQRGHIFTSSTDSEVLAHLIEEQRSSVGDLTTAVQNALHCVHGTFGIAVVSSLDPMELVAARRGSPLVLGIGEGEMLVSSDAAAIVAHTSKAIFLDDGDVARISREGYEIFNESSDPSQRVTELLDVNIRSIERGGYPHFMLKEIFDQPDTLRDAMRGRLVEEEGNSHLGGLADHMDRILAARRIVISACGTSWHAGMVGKYIIEELARKHVDVEYASEFRYRNPIIDSRDVMFVISQSGETADTLAALREAKGKGAGVFGICNAVGSSIARECHGGVYLHAGPEIGVASTKAFSSQLIVLTLIALAMGRSRGMSVEQGRTIVRELQSLPEKAAAVLRQQSDIGYIASHVARYDHALFLGRGVNYPVALEGALKLKEISYIHAEGYPAAEMKHGPIALVDRDMPVIFVAPRDGTYDKIVSNMQEVRARQGRIVVIANDDDDELRSLSDHIVTIPGTLDILNPILTVLPLQLLAYESAIARGTDVDLPRNLAKSVTVE